MKFAFFRAGRGIVASGVDSAGMDTRWTEFTSGAKEVGIQRGGYWRFFPSADLTWQVNSFCDRLTSIPLELPPMVDIEDAEGKTKAWLTDWAIAILTAVERSTVKVPLLYTNLSFLNTQLDYSRLTPWPVALARWTTDPDWPDPRAVFWQYAGNVKVSWATGLVDLQRCR